MENVEKIDFDVGFFWQLEISFHLSSFSDLFFCEKLFCLKGGLNSSVCRVRTKGKEGETLNKIPVDLASLTLFTPEMTSG